MTCHALFVTKHINSIIWVVFYGYESGPTIKDPEHKGHSEKKTMTPDVQFDSNSLVTCDQESFLSKTYNKQRFIIIDKLAEHFSTSAIYQNH